MIERICENCGKTFLKRKRAMKITKHGVIEYERVK